MKNLLLVLVVTFGFVACEKQTVAPDNGSGNIKFMEDPTATAQMLSDFDDFNIALFEIFDATVSLTSSELNTLRSLDSTNYQQVYTILGVAPSTFQQFGKMYQDLQSYNLSASDYSDYLYNSALSLDANSSIDMTTFYTTFTDFNPTSALPCWAYALKNVAIVGASLAGGAVSGPIGFAAGVTLAVSTIVESVDHLNQHGSSGDC